MNTWTHLTFTVRNGADYKDLRAKADEVAKLFFGDEPFQLSLVMEESMIREVSGPSAWDATVTAWPTSGS